MSVEQFTPADGAVTANDVGDAEQLMAAIDATIKPFDEGDVVSGTVVKIDKEEVLVDIGYKSEGVIPSRELSIRHDVHPREVVSIGEQIDALVLQKEDKEGRLILSKKRAAYEKAWGRIEDYKRSGEPVTGTVIEVVKGGLIVDIGLRGFLPASLVELRRVRDLQQFVGQEIECKVIELDKNRNNVVLSRRAYLEEAHSEQRKEFLENLAPGEVRTGSVSSIVNFGAFVDLGGVDGLIHVSELSWKHVEHPSEVVQVGDEVTVKVLSVELDRDRVSLSLKATQEDPWEAFGRVHQINDVVDGKVTKLVPFGAFVEVGEGIEGLVHISELAEEHIELPEQIVSIGQDVKVRVIDIDDDRRRISLSIKQADSKIPIEYSSSSSQAVATAESEAPPEMVLETAVPEQVVEVALEPEKPEEPEPTEEAKPEVEAVVELETEPRAEPQAEPETEPQAEPETEPQAEQKTEPETEPEMAGEMLEEQPAETGDSLESIVEEMKRDRT